MGCAIFLIYLDFARRCIWVSSLGVFKLLSTWEAGNSQGHLKCTVHSVSSPGRKSAFTKRETFIQGFVHPLGTIPGSGDVARSQSGVKSSQGTF